jgi:putative spermidine/putrescine transport system permease protein
MAATEAAAGRIAAPGPTLRSRLAERGVDRSLVLLAPAILALLGLFAYPFIYGLWISVHPQQGSGALSNYRSFFSDAYQRDTIFTTLKIALPATLINVLASVPIAHRMRGAFCGKRLLTAVLVIPVTLGTVLVAEGLLRYLGPRGWFNRVLMKTGLVDHPVQLVHNYWGVLLSLVITGFPFAFLLILSYMSGIDPTLERAAATLGAGPRQRFWRITMPLLAPGLATTFVLAFVLAFSVFPSASLVGQPSGPTRVISIAAYHAAFEKYDYSMGSSIAMVMGAVELAVIGLVLLTRSRLYRGPSTGGKG